MVCGLNSLNGLQSAWSTFGGDPAEMLEACRESAWNLRDDCKTTGASFDRVCDSYGNLFKSSSETIAYFAAKKAKCS